MRHRELKKLLSQAAKLTAGQRRELLARLGALNDTAQVVQVIESRPLSCPDCQGVRLVRNGQASGLQRYKCRACNRTFNALTGTPLAHLRKKALWEHQAQVLRDGLSVNKAAQRLGVAASTAFRWRHRFLKLPRAVMARKLQGVVEADETYFLRSRKGQAVDKRKPRHRGGRASKPGLSGEQEPVLVARDRSGATADFILEHANKACTVAALAPILAADAALCTDCGGAICSAARALGVEHHVINLSQGGRVQGPWHLQNVNGYHGGLKNWMKKFKGVASSYLASYLGWFRAEDRAGPAPNKPAPFLALAIGV